MLEVLDEIRSITADAKAAAVIGRASVTEAQADLDFTNGCIGFWRDFAPGVPRPDKTVEAITDLGSMRAQAMDEQVFYIADEQVQTGEVVRVMVDGKVGKMPRAEFEYMETHQPGRVRLATESELAAWYDGIDDPTQVVSVGDSLRVASLLHGD